MSIRESFAWRLPLTEADRQELWQNAFFVFDTNCLLDLYRQSEKSSREFLGILEDIQDRLWLPHQVFMEFLNNREKVIQSQKDLFKNVSRILDESTKSIKNDLLNEKKTGRFFSSQLLSVFDEKESEVNKILNSFKSGVKSEIDKLCSHYPYEVKDDWVLDQILPIFDSRVGDSYSSAKLEEVYQEGKYHYSQKIPPGFKDLDEKSDCDRRLYGDLVLWKQILDFASEKNTPVIFITNDNKEDWWSKLKGEKTPHYELRREFCEFTEKKFWIYTKDRFLKHIQDYLEIEVSEDFVKEAEADSEAEDLWGEDHDYDYKSSSLPDPIKEYRELRKQLQINHCDPILDPYSLRQLKAVKEIEELSIMRHFQDTKRMIDSYDKAIDPVRRQMEAIQRMSPIEKFRKQIGGQ